MREIPEEFLRRMRALPDFDYAAFEQALLYGEGRRGLRVNTLKLSRDEFAAQSPFALEPSPLCPEGFLLPPDSGAGKHPYHAAGLYYLQEPSAQSVVTALDPQPGMRILDLCAAPGGKSTHAAARLGDTGLLIANECVPARAQILMHNLERMGARRYAVTQAMPEAFTRDFAGWFDAVLADVPCSGEGMFRREPAAVREWTPAAAAACATRGRKILAAAANLVRPGGYLLYSTCTYHPDENEGAVERLLRERPDFELVPIDAVRLPPARPDWVLAHPEQDARGVRDELALAARLMLTDTPGEGHFLARLRRRDGDVPGQPPAAPYRALTKPEAAVFTAFWRDTFSAAPRFEPRATPRGDVYLVPDGLPACPSVLCPGVRVGTLCPGRALRFEPSHTLFMAAPAAELCRVLPLEPADPTLSAFFAGEEIPCALPTGYTAVCVTLGGSAFPVGFGKVSGGRLKNKLPTGLRTRFIT
ncbi:MAG: RsmB/NOP family class I SAM-dependent RNA methyltransferase [Clostridiaceae bacterium]|nr:RsmB/NOP family class I SAM-dependent RNA methyltransferase [Clostridiaceae bacterium]